MQGSIGQLGKISIHALREEGDVMPFADHLRLINFYPRPPRGGRPDESATEELIRAISIHALREEGDKDDRLSGNPNQIFLSTPSARRATVTAGVVLLHLQISIHALREEGDLPAAFRCTASRNFYPRPPRGGRPHACIQESKNGYFYPRPPRGGRQSIAASLSAAVSISIHALREEGDLAVLSLAGFLSTPSARRATFRITVWPSSSRFLSTPSARRATALLEL